MKMLRTSSYAWAIAMALATSAVLADAKSDLIAAARKLDAAKSYSWTTTVDLEGMPFKPGPTLGKRVKDGFTWVSSEMMGNKSEAYIKGGKGVAQVDGEWKTEDELPQFGGPGGPGGGRPGGPDGPREGGNRPPAGGGDRPNAGGPGAPGPGGPGGPPGGGGPGRFGGPGGGRGGFAAMGARRLIQTKAPHEAILLYADKIKDLKASDGSISGELPEEVVNDLAMFGRRGRGGPGGGGGGGGPSNAKGWIKVKIANGQITKTILEIESEMRDRDGGTQTVNAITTTEISDVGATKLEVPEAVKSKLEKADK